MKKVLATILMITIFVSLFTACGSDNPTTNAVDPNINIVDQDLNIDVNTKTNDDKNNTVDKNNVNYNSDDDGIYSEDENDLHITEVPDGYIGIYSAKDFQNISKNLKANYILMNDIDFSNFDFVPFEDYFEGTFDGNFYTISNYNSYAPIFAKIYDASILNVCMKNATIDRINLPDEVSWLDAAGIGGIVGYAPVTSRCNEIKFCKFEGTIKMYGWSEQDYTFSDVGGIIGFLGGEESVLSSCIFDGSIEIETGYQYSVGGIVGACYEGQLVANCYSTGHIKTRNKAYSVGGISGLQCCDIINCYSDISIDVNKCNNIGGIVGYLCEGNAKSLYYSGNINYNEIYSGKPSYWDEMEPLTSVTAGSIAGSLYYANIQYCYYLEGAYDAIGDGTPYANVVALSDIEMKQQDSFKGFDFSIIWDMSDNGYPIIENKLLYY